MVAKNINYYVAAGYSLSSFYNVLDIAATGGIGGTGLRANADADINNRGRINNANAYSGSGVSLLDGGDVNNGTDSYTAALIEGNLGIAISGTTGTVQNFGTVEGRGGRSILMFYGGDVTNGGYQDRVALLRGSVDDDGTGYITNYGTILSLGGGAAVSLSNGTIANRGAAATIEGSYGVQIFSGGVIRNTGTIEGQSRNGVSLYGGGTVVNGSGAYTHALIASVEQGLYGDVGACTVVNYGTITSANGAADFDGVLLSSGGEITNGSGEDRQALIDGASGILIINQAVDVTNYGTIAGTAKDGLDLDAGGGVVNGAATDTSALIEGSSGVYVRSAAGAVTNFGTILGESSAAAQYGVVLAAGGSVTNGSGADRTALIEGAVGVDIRAAPGTVINGGTIIGAAGLGVAVAAGGYLRNGSASNHAALIQGVFGAYLAAAVAVNFGTIAAVGDYASGVKLGAGATIINGGSGHAGAVIEGYNGLYAVAGATVMVTNFGTISGVGAPAVLLQSSTDVLNVEAGSTFIGAVYGGGGTLNLASGTGTISNFGTAALTVSGSMAATTFQTFNTVEVGAGATFTAAVVVTLAATQTVNSAGTLTLGAASKAVTSAGVIETTGTGLLTVAGALKNTGTIIADGGTLTVKGAVTGAGVGKISGGTLDLGSTFTENVTFTGTTGVLELAQSRGYTGNIYGFSKTGKTSLDLLDITFGGETTATFSGTTAGGTLTVTDGTHTALINLKGNYTTSTFVASSDGHGGTSVIDPRAKPSIASAALPQRFIDAMAGMGAGGVAGVVVVPDRREPGPMLIAPRAA